MPSERFGRVSTGEDRSLRKGVPGTSFLGLNSTSGDSEIDATPGLV